MKALFNILFLLGLTNTVQAGIVEEFHALKKEEQELLFLKKYRSTQNPDELGYLYAIEMKQVTYLYNPIKQLSIFEKYKELLEAAITRHPNNVHLRYVRLMVQEGAPAILRYKSKIKEDKLFLQSLLSKKDATDYLDYYIKLNTSL